MRTVRTIIVGILVLLVTGSFSYGAYEVKPITNDAFDDKKPQINNAGEVIYEKQKGDGSEIYMYDDGAEWKISSGAGYHQNPQINESGDALWETDLKERHYITIKPWWYFAFTLRPTLPYNSSQLLIQYFMGPTYPQFNDNLQVAWTASSNILGGYGRKNDLWFRGNANDYKGFWGCHDKELSDRYPQINTNGVVVFQRGEDVTCDPVNEQPFYDIFLYDSRIPGSGPINISQNPYIDDEKPQINDNGIVVWQSQGNIYRYYEGGAPEIISDSPECEGYEHTAPQIINQCGYVVWQGCNLSDCEIFLYNGNEAVNISNHSQLEDFGPQINEQGDVVWVKDYDSGIGIIGPVNGNLSKGNEIMLYRHSDKSVANISNRIGDDENPQINDVGEIVWSGYDQGDWEIFKATRWELSASKPKLKIGTIGKVGTIGKIEPVDDIGSIDHVKLCIE